MDSTSSSTAHAADYMTARADSKPSLSSMEWKAQCSIWTNVLSTKDTRACELATVHATLFKVARHTAAMNQTTKFSELTGQLLESRIILEKHLIDTQQEAEHAQRMIDFLTADVVVPKARHVQNKIFLQMAECLQGTDPNMKVCDLLEKITTNLITIETPPSNKNQNNSTSPQEPELARGVTKWNTNQQSKHLTLGFDSETPLGEETRAFKTPQKQTETAHPDTRNIENDQKKERRNAKIPIISNNGKIRMKTKTVGRTSSAAQETVTATNKVNKVPTHQRATKSTVAKSFRRAEAAVAPQKQVQKDANAQVAKSSKTHKATNSSTIISAVPFSQKSTSQFAPSSSGSDKSFSSAVVSSPSPAMTRPLQRKSSATEGRKGQRQAGEPGVARKLTARERNERLKKREEEKIAKQAQEAFTKESTSESEDTQMRRNHKKSQNSKTKGVKSTTVDSRKNEDDGVPVALEGLDTSNIIWAGSRRRTGDGSQSTRDSASSGIETSNGSKRKRDNDDEEYASVKKVKNAR
ncbi:predicted protein [Plenodomus lingam JN3]|uniref:Predicted protein n=1 Tax=Leptosphaeria maculans (strain JN3 / isolate v23.1.3 / race Av1-4-5-6-7-8) TaxID=985895 RepID=E4ZTE4_LEPMJ|nr:predicted protein [Plenodomus lingam JN3]CBX94800.1 predicted protein [Plenodomus lingam JN3]